MTPVHTSSSRIRHAQRIRAEARFRDIQWRAERVFKKHSLKLASAANKIASKAIRSGNVQP